MQSMMIARDSLASALAIVKRATDRRSRIPILSATRVRAVPGGLAIAATDLDRMITVTVPDAAADDGFDAAIPLRMLADMVKASKAETVTVHAAGEAARLDLDGAKATLQTLPVADFPEFPGCQPLDRHTFTIMSDVLGEAFRRVSFAISTEETRYYLCGAYLQVHHSGALRVVATDGHRLSLWNGPAAPEGAEGMPAVLIPAVTVADVLAMIGKRKPPVPVRVTVTPAKVEFATDRVTILTKTIDGTFPDYQRVVPALNPKHLTIGKAALAALIKGVSAVSDERDRAVKLTVDSDGDGAAILTASVQNPGAGAVSACEEVECVGFGRGEFTIGFNAGYLLDALASLPGATVTLAMSDPGSPILIHDGDGTGSLVVQMPMRV